MRAHDYVANLTTEDFWEILGNKFDAPLSTFIVNNKSVLYFHVHLLFDGLRCYSTMSEYDDEFLANYTFARFGNEIKHIFDVLTQTYNPLHNVDVTERETNDGKDNHSYGGSDVTALTNSNSSTHYVQNDSDSTTYGSTYDDTVEENMKPISKTIHHFDTDQTTTASSSGNTTYGKTLEMEYGRIIEKERKGNIGVMPTQQLLELEYDARFRMILFDSIIRLVVSGMSCGVWETDSNVLKED